MTAGGCDLDANSRPDRGRTSACQPATRCVLIAGGGSPNTPGFIMAQSRRSRAARMNAQQLAFRWFTDFAYQRRIHETAEQVILTWADWEIWHFSSHPWGPVVNVDQRLPLPKLLPEQMATTKSTNQATARQQRPATRN